MYTFKKKFIHVSQDIRNIFQREAGKICTTKDLLK